MSLWKRLGSHKKKYEFYITIHSIQTSFSDPVLFKVQWKRRKKLSETSEFYLSSQSPLINQTLTMENTIYAKSSGALSKEAKLQVFCNQSGSWKPFGSLTLDLALYIYTPVTEKILGLKDCPDKKCSICVSVLTKYDQNTAKIDTDGLLNEINDTKNKLAMLESEFEAAFEERGKAKSEFVILKSEVLEIGESGNRGAVERVKEENEGLKKKIWEIREEIRKRQEKNEQILGEIKQKEVSLMEKAKKILGDKANDNLGEVFAEILARY